MDFALRKHSMQFEKANLENAFPDVGGRKKAFPEQKL